EVGFDLSHGLLGSREVALEVQLTNDLARLSVRDDHTVALAARVQRDFRGPYSDRERGVSSQGTEALQPRDLPVLKGRLEPGRGRLAPAAGQVWPLDVRHDGAPSHRIDRPDEPRV